MATVPRPSVSSKVRGGKDAYASSISILLISAIRLVPRKHSRSRIEILLATMPATPVFIEWRSIAKLSGQGTTRIVGAAIGSERVVALDVLSRIAVEGLLGALELQ